MKSPKSQSTTRKKRGPGPPKGSQNAAKPAAIRKTERVVFLATRSDVAQYYSAAEAEKKPLGTWIRSELSRSNAASCEREKNI